MSIKIAIASGKGGTGKTTVSVNLFHFLDKNMQKKVLLVDCDVEEPNARLFFDNLPPVSNNDVFVKIPSFDAYTCTLCKKCAEYCEFNAISIITDVKYIEVHKELCHSCGACTYACKHDAITEIDEKIGSIGYYKTSEMGILAEGCLKIGSALQTTLISQLKEQCSSDYDIILYDAPPGNSCPVVETVENTDYVILVTEPTPFGLHDLKITVELLQNMNKPFGVIINKAGLGNKSIYTFLNDKKITLLGEIPFDRTYATQYANGDLFSLLTDNISSAYDAIVNKLFDSISRNTFLRIKKINTLE